METEHQKIPQRKVSAKNNLYIISGWHDTTGRAPYQKLYKLAVQKGYGVVKINPEWDEPLSQQIFPVTKDDVVFGFSMGAILACMIGKRYSYKKLILASMTPVLDLSKQTLKILGKVVSDDCQKFRYGGVKATYFYGEEEVDRSLDKIMPLGIKIVPGTGFQLTDGYIMRIVEEL